MRVLRTLSLFPEKTFTGRQLAEMAGAPPSKAIQELERLKGAGIVTRETHGNAHAWRANTQHAVFRLLAQAFEAEHGLRKAMIGEIVNAVRDERVARAVLFGSFARGDERPESDVDVLVLARRAADVDDVRRSLDGLAIRLARTYGARLSAIVHAEAELPRLRRTRLLANIRKEGRALKGEMP